MPRTISSPGPKSHGFYGRRGFREAQRDGYDQTDMLTKGGKSTGKEFWYFAQTTLAAFGVVGCHVALEFGTPFVIAVFMGMATATGGGVIRDVLTNTQPMILCGQPYATAALLGSLSYASLRYLGVPEIAAQLVACLAAFSLRASAIVFNIRMGPPGEFIRFGETHGNGSNGN